MCVNRTNKLKKIHYPFLFSLMIDFTHKFSFDLQPLDFCSLAAAYPGKHICNLFPFVISLSRNDKIMTMTRYICGIHGRRNSFKHCFQQRPFPEFLTITNPWHREYYSSLLPTQVLSLLHVVAQLRYQGNTNLKEESFQRFSLRSPLLRLWENFLQNF